MPRILTPSENHTIDTLGIYGVWLLKHGRKISRESDVAAHYAAYMADKRGRNALALFRAIDRFCEEQGMEKPFRNIEESVEDLVA